MIKMDKKIAKRKKKTAFVRHDSHKKPGISPAWRRPKGLQNKVRLGLRGYRIKPGSGYRTALSERYKCESGKDIVKITSINSLEGLDPKRYILMIQGNMGDRKLSQLLPEVKKRGFHLLNYDIDAKLEKIRKSMDERRKAASEKKKIRAEKHAEEDKKAKKKESAKAEDNANAEDNTNKSLEDKADDVINKEKQAKDKVLTKK